MIRLVFPVFSDNRNFEPIPAKFYRLRQDIGIAISMVLVRIDNIRCHLHHKIDVLLLRFGGSAIALLAGYATSPNTRCIRVLHGSHLGFNLSRKCHFADQEQRLQMLEQVPLVVQVNSGLDCDERR